MATVDYATSDGSATADVDYYPVSGTITWADGDASDKTIGIPIRPDTAIEGSEDLLVTLSNPSGADLDGIGSSATVTILDPAQRCTAFAPAFFNQTVNAIAPLDDGRILIGGTINQPGTEFGSIFNLARLHPDGSVDSSFLTGFGFDDAVLALEVLPDGKILAGGEFTSYDGSACNRIVRLNADGTVDSTFLANIGSGADGHVRDIAVESDGRILLGGDFLNFDGTGARGLVRLNADGTPAAALSLPFNTGFQARVYSIIPEAGGKILVGGSFYIAWTGSGFRSGVARLNSDGTRDSSFDPDAGAHASGSTSSIRTVSTMAALPDGKYLLGGSFTAYDETNIPYLARIENDGSLDPAFTPPAFDDNVEALLLQPDGAILAGGRFSVPSSGAARLNPDGTVDPTFEVGTGTHNGASTRPVYAFALDDNGALFAGGNFFDWMGQSSRPVIKLVSGITPYDLWAADNFTPAQIAAGDAAPTADPDGDQFENAAERALATPPLVANPDPVFGPDGSAVVSLHSGGGMEYLQVSVEKSGATQGAWFAAQLTSDLYSWSPNPALPGANTAYDILEDSPARFVIRDKTPLNGKRFVRFVIWHPN